MKSVQKERTIPTYAKLVKGYMGFLTGTGKSISTISCYQGDLSLLERFLREKKKDFYRLNAKDFASYYVWLEKQGLKTNTRRRKILSAKALVKYAVSRKKVAASAIQFVKTPERLERLPWIPTESEFGKILACLKAETPLGLRNLLIVRLLAETAMTVAEVCSLRWDQCAGEKIECAGKKARAAKISADTKMILERWRKANPGKNLFPGFNRHGPTSERMTPRGVELFFRHLSKQSGFRSLKPKTLRHYAITAWLRENLAESEIHRRLGVHPNFSFHAYRKFLERA
jgi:site-specific recombinase XerD